MLAAFVAAQESATGAPDEGDGFGFAVNDVIFTAGFTVTVTCDVTLPAGFVAVRVYVVVVVGVTSCDAPSDTFPIPLLIETEVAFSTTQNSVAVWPATMVCGAAENRMMRATAPVVTVTAALHEADDPPGPLAVTVYVVDAVGVTTTLPFAPTVPTPLLIVTEVALVV
jgi:hypothetical protein